MQYVVFLSLLALIAFGGTNSMQANIGALGNPADVTCYSGGVEIYKGKSTGRVATVSNSDGWEFKDAATGKFVRVSGTCVIIN